MALGTPTALFHTEETLKTTDSTLSVPSDVPAGATVVLTVGHAVGLSTVKKVSDNSGNVYRWRMVRAGTVQTAAGVPPQVSMFYVYCPNGLASGTTITVQFNLATSMTRIFHCLYMTGQARPDKSAVATATATTWSVATTDNTAFSSEVAIAACAIGADTTSTDTSSPAMTELYDTGATNATSGDRALVTQYRTGVSSGATVTASGAFAGGSSRRYNALVVTFREYLTGNSYATEVNADSPTNWWHLDETVGATAVDDPGTADGTYVNTPSLNQTGAFGGSGASVLHTAASQEDTTLPFSVGVSVDVTIEAWVKAPTPIVTAAMRDNTGAAGWIVLLASSNGTYTSRLANTNLLWPLGHLDDGEWHHVVVTRSGTTGAVYIDGQKVITGTVGTGAFTSPLHLAKNGTASSWEDISHDEVARYTTALSWDRVRAHFDAAVSVRITAIAQATETDTAGAITARKTRTLGQATETDTAGAVTAPIARAVAQATETDTAGAVTPRQQLGRATETDTAGATTPTGTVSQATETDTASRLAVPLGRATETDTAGAVTTPTAITQTVAQATETDTAGTVTRQPPVGRATETDTARRLALIIGRATETDTAQRLATTVPLDRAVETDAAGAIAALFTQAVAQATETDTAGAVTARLSLVQADETDTAGTVTRLLIREATETDTARPIVRLLIGRATETDTAPTITVTKFLYPDTWQEPEPTVFEPELIAGQELSPAFVDPDSVTVVFAPTLVTNQELSPDTWQEPEPVVFEPELSSGEALEPDTFVNPEPVVFSPRLIAGQPLQVGAPYDNPEPVVYEPHLIAGQELHPDAWQEPEPVVFEPALVAGQLLYPDTWQEPEPVVFEPELRDRQPPVIVGDETRTLSAIRTAR